MCVRGGSWAVLRTDHAKIDTAQVCIYRITLTIQVNKSSRVELPDFNLDTSDDKLTFL